MPGATVFPRVPSALVMGSAEELLAGSGCPACAYVSEAVEAHLAWFALEAHADPAMIARLRGSLGMCPPHTRALISQPGAEVRLTAVSRYVVDAARRALAAGQARLAACPACEHEQAAAARALDILLEGLAEEQVRRRYQDGGGLCFAHLRAAVSRPRWRSRGRRAAAWLARDAARRAATRAPGLDALAGWPDRDAQSRAALRGLLPSGSARQPGVCPVCLTAARFERDALRRFVTDGPVPSAADEGAPREQRLCGPHLRDAAGLDDGRAPVLLARQARVEIALCERIAHGRRPAAPAWRRSGAARSGDVPGCPVCRARDVAARRALTASAGPGGDLCVRDALALAAADPDAGKAALRLAAERAGLLVGELTAAFEKRTWEHRHEKAGAEMTAWLRAAAFLDGRVFGGGPAAAA